MTFSNREVVIALSAARMVNMAMVMMAASAFHSGHSNVAEIETAYHTLTPLLGAASFFLLSLIASGVSSSVVGTMVGQLNNMRFEPIESAQCKRAIDLNKRLAIIGIKMQNEVRC